MLSLTYFAEVVKSLTWVSLFPQVWVLPLFIYINVVDLTQINKWTAWAVLTIILGYPSCELYQTKTMIHPRDIELTTYVQRTLSKLAGTHEIPIPSVRERRPLLFTTWLYRLQESLLPISIRNVSNTTYWHFCYPKNLFDPSSDKTYSRGRPTVYGWQPNASRFSLYEHRHLYLDQSLLCRAEPLPCKTMECAHRG